jgi:hypothetical protein
MKKQLFLIGVKSFRIFPNPSYYVVANDIEDASSKFKNYYIKEIDSTEDLTIKQIELISEEVLL